MSVAIRFENVSKLYKVGSSNKSLRESIVSLSWKIFNSKESDKNDHFWSLKDVSFTVERGEAIGIIGHNGAGKTTTLKILSRVTKPTHGLVETNGRLSSLIELGAGFHPDLTGRENVYLNGAILGLSREKIDGLFDEIVAFAELERFIDTPVKRYSSGMYARLGFSVAAHISPDILLVDEVLSVGDIPFQTKCAERMQQLRANGATIVFISHNMHAVRGICDRCILMEKGQIRYQGRVDEVIKVYQDTFHNKSSRQVVRGYGNGNSVGTKAVDITKVELFDKDGNYRDKYELGESLVARIHYKAHREIKSPVFSVGFIRSDGLNVCSNTSAGQIEPERIKGPGIVQLSVPELKLIPDNYSFVALVSDKMSLKPYAMEYMAVFQIVSTKKFIDKAYGVFLPTFEWQPITDLFRDGERSTGE
jgi:lipopolysaccharide transport system ATP-binding protein